MILSKTLFQMFTLGDMQTIAFVISEIFYTAAHYLTLHFGFNSYRGLKRFNDRALSSASSQDADVELLLHGIKS